MPEDTLAAALEIAAAASVPVWWEPVSVPKATKVVSVAAHCMSRVTCISPNQAELVAIAGALETAGN